MKIAQRAERIQPFFVMEIAKEAQRLAAQVADSADPMIFLNIGEPDFSAPDAVQQAATDTMRAGETSGQSLVQNHIDCLKRNGAAHRMA